MTSLELEKGLKWRSPELHYDLKKVVLRAACPCSTTFQCECPPDGNNSLIMAYTGYNRTTITKRHVFFFILLDQAVFRVEEWVVRTA